MCVIEIDLITKLNDYLKQLPIIGFNFSKYDINAIKPYLFKDFVDKSESLNDIKEEQDEEEE